MFVGLSIDQIRNDINDLRLDDPLRLWTSPPNLTRMDRETDQVETVRTTAERIMRHADFKLGVDDVRNGRPPRFDNYDEINDQWLYERGRLFAIIAPASMPLRIQGKLNPKAVALYRAAYNRGYVV